MFLDFKFLIFNF